MIVTEDKAKTKWCPFARVSRNGGGNRYPMDNDLADATAFARCIASDCMAWRWNEKPGHEYDERWIDKPAGEMNPPFSNCPEDYEVSMCGIGYSYRAQKQIGDRPGTGHCGITGDTP